MTNIWVFWYVIPFHFIQLKVLNSNWSNIYYLIYYQCFLFSIYFFLLNEFETVSERTPIVLYIFVIFSLFYNLYIEFEKNFFLNFGIIFNEIIRKKRLPCFIFRFCNFISLFLSLIKFKMTIIFFLWCMFRFIFENFFSFNVILLWDYCINIP